MFAISIVIDIESVGSASQARPVLMSRMCEWGMKKPVEYETGILPELGQRKWGLAKASQRHY